MECDSIRRTLIITFEKENFSLSTNNVYYQMLRKTFENKMQLWHI